MALLPIYRRRPLSPDSPQPSRPLRSKITSLFPPEDSTSSALRLDGLIDYLKDYNKTSQCRLQIWTATTRSLDHVLPDPLVVRFIIRDVVTFYLTLGTASPDAVIIVESATAFGSREKVRLCLRHLSRNALNSWFQKPPHSQSDYIVFQKLSQHLAKMLHANPRVSFQLMTVRDRITQTRCSIYASAHMW